MLTILVSSIEMREHRVLAERKRKNLWNKLMRAAGARIDANFGKDARFSTYTPAREILQNPEATEVVRRFIPMVGMLTDEMIEEIGSFNIQELAKMHGRLLMLSRKKMEKIDQALSEIPIGSESERRDGEIDGDKVLDGDQIVHVLAAGLFAGSDCAAMLEEDYLNGESKVAPTRGGEIIQDGSAITWQALSSGPEGFRFS